MQLLSLMLACSGPATEPVDSDTDSPVDTDSEADAATCARYTEVTEGLSEGVWTGDVAACDAGTAPEEGVAGAVARVDYARELAGLPPVTIDSPNAASAQDCALMMHANDSLSHGPPDTWSCFTQAGADAAAAGLLAREPAVGAVQQYLVDFGNETTLVHRRWLLNPGLPSVAIGTTDAFSCLRLGSLVLDSDGWVAWPPPGRVPLQMLSEATSDVDAEGWSIQSDAIDLGPATVTVEHEGDVLPQTVETLTELQGSLQALRFVPDGFETRAGRYRVRVDGVAEPFDYEVIVVDCGP